MANLPVIQFCEWCVFCQKIPGLDFAQQQKKKKTHRCGFGNQDRRKQKHVDPYAEPPESCPMRREF